VSRNEEPSLHVLIKKLADGRFHSGSDLAICLGVTRSAVWKKIRKLSELGLDVRRVRSLGYKLMEPLDLLDREAIHEALGVDPADRGFILEIRQQVDSTNRVLIDRARGESPGPMVALLAEQQTQGRGRRGRTWSSPFGRNIYLSLLWNTRRTLKALDGLSLSIGVAVAKVLRDEFGVSPHLKWPNDILVNGRKIGGILIDVDGDFSGPLNLVIGLGLNVNMGISDQSSIEQPWTDLASETGLNVSRSIAAGKLLAELTSTLSQFEQGGFPQFRREWIELDAYAGKPVSISGQDGALQGTARGIDETGALLIEVEGEVIALSAGDVSLRTVQ
jgi:BirA family biotin operon repressor/biotin-[acetyl-CoA-carboxylase] ligase